MPVTHPQQQIQGIDEQCRVQLPGTRVAVHMPVIQTYAANGEVLRPFPIFAFKELHDGHAQHNYMIWFGQLSFEEQHRRVLEAIRVSRGLYNHTIIE